ncbi:MAG: hypothetical protein M3Y24_04025 [Acidobacteriota bacterium]|nr:hypothetical protein [Acidobacteriota bacterium]
MLKITFVAGLLLVGLVRAVPPGPAAAKSPDQVIQAYVGAVGGQTAVDRIETREVRAQRHHGPKLVYYWQKPNKVLVEEGKKKAAFDGHGGWEVSTKKRVTKLAKGSQVPLLMDADPLRYVYLKQLYPDVQSGAPETVDGRKMDVLQAANDLGSTKFFFDGVSHLLVRIDEKGETSAYFNYVTEFSDYQQVDDVKFPFRIVHDSTEPDAKENELRISQVMQNVPLRPDLFNKPSLSSIVLGGRR